MAVGLVAIFGWLLYAVKVGVGWWKYRQLKGGHDKTHGMLNESAERDHELHQKMDILTSFAIQISEQVQQGTLGVEEVAAIAKSTGTDSLLEGTIIAGHTRLSGQLSTHEKSNTPVSIVAGSEHASSLARKASIRTAQTAGPTSTLPHATFRPQPDRRSRTTLA